MLQMAPELSEGASPGAATFLRPKSTRGLFYGGCMDDTTKARFIAKVNKDHPSGCWLWTASANLAGYGQFGSPGLAHRASYMLFVGPIPPGLCVLHKCDTPACVNPAHLWVGTNAENSRDMVSKGRSPRGVRHGRAKLTAGDVLSIRSSDGVPHEVLAAQYGVSRSNIGLILNRKTWRHVT